MLTWHDGWDEGNDDPVDEDDESEDDLDECPRCGRRIYSDSVRCPQCGGYPSREELPATTRHPWWVKVTALGCLAWMLHWLLRL